jgi:hypothetical protein
MSTPAQEAGKHLSALVSKVVRKIKGSRSASKLEKAAKEQAEEFKGILKKSLPDASDEALEAIRAELAAGKHETKPEEEVDEKDIMSSEDVAPKAVEVDDVPDDPKELLKKLVGRDRSKDVPEKEPELEKPSLDTPGSIFSQEEREKAALPKKKAEATLEKLSGEEGDERADAVAKREIEASRKKAAKAIEADAPEPEDRTAKEKEAEKPLQKLTRDDKNAIEAFLDDISDKNTGIFQKITELVRGKGEAEDLSMKISIVQGLINDEKQQIETLRLSNQQIEKNIATAKKNRKIADAFVKEHGEAAFKEAAESSDASEEIKRSWELYNGLDEKEKDLKARRQRNDELIKKRYQRIVGLVGPLNVGVDLDPDSLADGTQSWSYRIAKSDVEGKLKGIEKGSKALAEKIAAMASKLSTSEETGKKPSGQQLFKSKVEKAADAIFALPSLVKYGEAVLKATAAVKMIKLSAEDIASLEASVWKTMQQQSPKIKGDLPADDDEEKAQRIYDRKHEEKLAELEAEGVGLKKRLKADAAKANEAAEVAKLSAVSNIRKVLYRLVDSLR